MDYTDLPSPGACQSANAVHRRPVPDLAGLGDAVESPEADLTEVRGDETVGVLGGALLLGQAAE